MTETELKSYRFFICGRTNRKNARFRQIEVKYEVDKTILQELNPQLSITFSGYEKLTEQLGKDETLDYFNRELDKLNESKR